MGIEEVRSLPFVQNLVIANVITKVAVYSVEKAVKSNEGVFGPAKDTVNNQDIRNLLETIVINRIKTKVLGGGE